MMPSNKPHRSEGAKQSPRGKPPAGFLSLVRLAAVLRTAAKRNLLRMGPFLQLHRQGTVQRATEIPRCPALVQDFPVHGDQVAFPEIGYARRRGQHHTSAVTVFLR